MSVTAIRKGFALSIGLGLVVTPSIPKVLCV